LRHRDLADEAEKARQLERARCREQVNEWMRRGIDGEAEMRRVIERWAQVDEAEAEEAEREVRRAVEKAREEEESKKE
jgi:hypothetical protein